MSTAAVLRDACKPLVAGRIGPAGVLATGALTVKPSSATVTSTTCGCFSQSKSSPDTCGWACLCPGISGSPFPRWRLSWDLAVS